MSDLHDDVRGTDKGVPTAGQAVAPPRLRRRRRGRVRRLVVRGVAVATVALALLAVVQLLQSRSDLMAARDALNRGVGSLTAGRPEDALPSFDSARRAARAADDRLSGPVLGVAGAVPVAGASVRAASAVASGARLVAEAGQELSVAAITLPEGVSALAPRDGRIPVDAIASVAPALGRAHEMVGEARALVEASPEALLVGPVGGARAELLAQLQAVDPQLETAAAVAEALPALLGADGPRRYFLAAQNPAELRGTGGFIGAYSILTVDDGRLGFDTFQSIIDLSPLPVGGVEPPSLEYRRLYGWAGGAGFGQNANMTADVPSAAVALERLYERVKGRELDGAILVDPFAFESLLRVAGPVVVPGIGTVTGDTVVDQITNEAYAVLPDAERKELLGAVAAATLTGFLSDGAADNPVRAAETLIEVAAGGHLLIHAEDADVMAALDTADVTGRLDAPGDLLAVVGNNAAQNKVDFYTDRQVSHDVWLAEDGSATAETTVWLSNDAPTSGMPLDVIGPNVDYLEAGENRTLMSVYCGRGCVHQGTTRDGEEAEPTLSGTELGWTLVATREQIASGETVEVTHRFRLPRAWDPEEMTYRLRLRGQQTIRPTTFDVRVHTPDGLLVRDASSGLAVGDRAASWSGSLRDVRDVEVRLGPPARSAFQRFVDWLREPALTVG